MITLAQIADLRKLATMQHDAADALEASQKRIAELTDQLAAKGELVGVIDHGEFVMPRGQYRQTVWTDEKIPVGTNLYTTPQAAPALQLSDEEIARIYDSVYVDDDSFYYRKFARAILAAAGEQSADAKRWCETCSKGSRHTGKKCPEWECRTGSNTLYPRYIAEGEQKGGA